MFDLEHTLMASNVVDTYAWLASRHLPAARRAKFVADLLRQAPSLLALDRRDRGDFLRSFYRRFEGAPAAQLRHDSWELFHTQLLTRSFPEGFARVRAHRALGHRTLLITGALDFIIAPVRPLFDDIVCAQMGERDGLLTGHLTNLPPSARRGRWCCRSTPPRTISRWRSRWPTPTRPATWPCSKRSASRSPSIPKHAWRRSPGAAAGTWSTGPRRRAARTGPCRSAPST